MVPDTDLQGKQDKNNIENRHTAMFFLPFSSKVDNFLGQELASKLEQLLL